MALDVGAKKIMRHAQLMDIISRLPSSPRTKRTGVNYLSIPCVFGHRHRSGRDRNPSMTISFDKGLSRVRCFGCDYSGSLLKMLTDYSSQVQSVSALLVQAMDYESDTSVDVDISLEPDPLVENDYTEALEVHASSDFPKHAETFLASKGVSIAAAKRFGLRFVPEGHSDEWFGEDELGNSKTTKADSILLPCMIKEGLRTKCVGAMVRYINAKYFTIYKFSSSRYFFGEQYMELMRGKPVLLVEGPLDVVHLMSVGVASLGLWGVNLSKEKALKLQSMGAKEILVALDPDEPGQAGAKKVSKMLTQHQIPHRILHLTKDPRTCSAQDIRDTLKATP